MKIALTKEYEGRRLTWLGRMLMATLFLVVFIGLLKNLYIFLAPENPPHSGLMVVEGWIDDFALDEAVRMYRTGNYSKIVCTGVPVETGSYIQQFKSYPEMTTARLIALGVAPEEIITAVADDNQKDRTYSSATTLKEYLIAYNIEETSIHLISVGPHTRRSRLLFRKALGKDYTVGATSLEPPSYEPEEWYQSSHGFRSVIGEFLAYIYARFFFYP
jgi:uncharacterized SAM-binding protein YcdF (DUF218 family)